MGEVVDFADWKRKKGLLQEEQVEKPKQDWYDVAMERIQNMDQQEVNRVIEEHLNNELRCTQIASSEEYINWLTSLVKDKKCIDTETMLYHTEEYTQKDLENINYIAYFHEKVKKKAALQGKFLVPSNHDFYEESLYFKYQGSIYYICLLVGQGAQIIVRVTANDEDIRYENLVDMELKD